MGDETPADDGTTTTTRLEAFSDGVFAIAITLLILEIKVPAVGEGGAAGLGAALLARWPSYVAYVVSFLTIGVIWANHHAVMDHVRRADRGLLMVTVFFLLAVSFLPFPTAVLAEHLAGGPGRDRTIAALFLGGSFFWMAVAFNVLWFYIRRAGLLHDPEHPGARTITANFRYGPLTYLVVTLVALVSVPASVAALGLLAVYWGLPRSSGTTRARPGGA
ncbi:MAG TPA: TMEM175 family protein [Gemmatirosa sp.]